MWTGSGDRERCKKVKFVEPFGSAPGVHVSIALWDMDTNAAIRAEIFADKITKKGFEIVFRTWADSRIARLRASWMAIGELPFDDDWEDVL
jgi:hypothetical protein